MSRAMTLGQAIREYDELVRDLARGSCAEVREMLAAKPLTLETVAEAIAAGFHGLDIMQRQVWATAAREGEPTPACREGCAFCCYQEVILSTVEVVGILARTDPADWPALVARAERTVQRTAGNPALRYRNAIPCAFQEGTRCGIYDARPSPCRTHYLTCG